MNRHVSGESDNDFVHIDEDVKQQQQDFEKSLLKFEDVA
jgi:hypothetical protein